MSVNINVEEAVAEGVARADQGQVGLGGLAPLFQRREQFRIEPRQAGEVLGTEAVRLAPLAIDEPKLPGVGHQHLVTALLQEEPANPRRMGADLAIATHIGSEPEKRLWSAAGLVGIRLSSSTTSPLAVSIRHRRWLLPVAHVDADGDGGMGHGQEASFLGPTEVRLSCALSYGLQQTLLLRPSHPICRAPSRQLGE